MTEQVASSISGPIIELENVHLTLGHAASSVHVLKGVSLSIMQGRSVGIVGPSGSGKSTLLMVLAGLEHVDQGSVKIAGETISQMSEDQAAAFRGANIGIVFQSFHLIPNMTALENVAVPLELAGRKDAFEVAERELRAVGLGERLTHYPSELSGGEQQRVAIARALAPSPKILIADEPTGNLDTATGRQITDLLFSKQRENGLTMVLVTHDPSLAARCDQEIPVRSGRIEEPARKEPALEEAVAGA
ncbi:MULTISPECIES: ABC transporter ATP-binding protein [Ochrobactrum]|uniref:ABC transporter ATP-binding protein n=1 Tax=Ochrobactrum chromiisoli TaxID=2993941 RepID=A0ABT3QIU2_9HYPH|nr:ABC transporter ATP-binding protein [Ochrobactrum chromiisoli]MCX2695500.1 ABC transporter ATP-binding protein [Ochrobactrum chromiisoli]